MGYVDGRLSESSLHQCEELGRAEELVEKECKQMSLL